MTKRFIGQVLHTRGAHTGTSYVGWIYDTTKRRAETGVMAQDFAFADLTEASKTRDVAERCLSERLAELNAQQEPIANA